MRSPVYGGCGEKRFGLATLRVGRRLGVRKTDLILFENGSVLMSVDGVEGAEVDRALLGECVGGLSTCGVDVRRVDE